MSVVSLKIVRAGGTNGQIIPLGCYSNLSTCSAKKERELEHEMTREIIIARIISECVRHPLRSPSE